MLVIGLTGGFASGKTTVAQLFEKWGAVTINSDEVVHRLLSPKGACFKKVAKTFGTQILISGKIDRKKLAQVVFTDQKKLRQLEQIIHPEVGRHRHQIIREYQKRKRVKALIFEIPLLYETKVEKEFDLTIVVVSTQRNQVARARKKFHISAVKVLQRIRQQMPMKAKIKKADYCINNNGTKRETEKQAKEVWLQILKRSKS